MTAELGLFFLIIAFATACMQSLYILPFKKLSYFIEPTLVPAQWLQSLMITLSLGTLVILRLDDDFSVANVVAHSNRSLPILYKIVGTWGNHEGSMLLWAWVVAICAMGLALRHPPTLSSLVKTAVSVQSIICTGVLAFILFTSNPFIRIFPPTSDGEALNPLLQHIAMAIHPPLLYLGYVGFSIVFSLAVAAILHGRMGREWAHMAHPWILGAWSMLTLGIGLGSWWAYRVLGWGGFWFWDPVENASLLPWLAGTALLHANIVLKKRGMLMQWVLLLSIITFGLSLLGTFLVRSGLLTSVHSFASDPERGVFILIYITLLLGWALSLFAFKASKLSSKEQMLPLTREGMIVVNNLFLLTACGTVLLGTIYPILAEWISNETITVGPPYYNVTALPLLAIPLLFAGLVPFMPWKKSGLRQALKDGSPMIMSTFAIMIFVYSIIEQEALLGSLGIGLSVWLTSASIFWLFKNRHSAGGISVCLGHVGAAMLIIGITGASLWKEEKELWMMTGDSTQIGGYHLTLQHTSYISTDNHSASQAHLTVMDTAKQLTTTLVPEYRLYTIRQSSTAIPSIYPTWTGDLYAVIGERIDNKTSVKLYYNPMISFLWIGFMLMALGGIVSIFRHSTRTYYEP